MNLAGNLTTYQTKNNVNTTTIIDWIENFPNTFIGINGMTMMPPLSGAWEHLDTSRLLLESDAPLLPLAKNVFMFNQRKSKQDLLLDHFRHGNPFDIASIGARVADRLCLPTRVVLLLTKNNLDDFLGLEPIN